jgi:RNA polymerase Rpb2, domain 6
MGMQDNLKTDPAVLGLTNLISSGYDKSSGGRHDLFSKNATQTRVLKDPEFPDMFTGFETFLGDYTFDSTRRRNEIKIINIVDKYTAQMSNVRMGNNPLRTVIYRDMITGEVSYFDIRKYSSYTNDYGYENVMRSTIQVGDVIPPEQEIYSSVAKDGPLYSLGINANVAYVTTLETTEDCFAISESLAEKMSPLSVETRRVVADMKRYPLNLYGDDESYKIFPDIGDVVNNDGVLCGFRPIRRFSAISDLQPEKLRHVNHLFDEKIYAHPGAKVIDIEIYVDSRSKLPEKIYEQIRTYHRARMSYWREIVNVYESVKSIPISPKFNTLVTRAMGRLLADKQNVPDFGKRSRVELVDRFNPVTLHIDVTLAHRVAVNKGHKIAGREGGKGVVLVKPDHEMPCDEQGFRADVCIDPISVLKRTNIIQLYEQYINRLLKWQAMNLDSVGGLKAQYNRVLELLHDLNPEYAKVVARTHPTPKSIEALLNECKRDTIKICTPPGVDSIDSQKIKYLHEKYQTPISPVTFSITTSKGVKQVTTKDPVCIGSKYILLLSKYPKPLAPGYGFVNKCHMPINAKNKNASPIGTTPIRFGESESRIFAAAMDIDAVLRFKCLYSGSRIGPRLMVEALMNSVSPSALPRVNVTTEELYDDNPSIRIAHHMFETCGINVQKSLISDVEAEQLIEDIKLVV